MKTDLKAKYNTCVNNVHFSTRDVHISKSDWLEPNLRSCQGVVCGNEQWTPSTSGYCHYFSGTTDHTYTLDNFYSLLSELGFHSRREKDLQYTTTYLLFIYYWHNVIGSTTSFRKRKPWYKKWQIIAILNICCIQAGNFSHIRTQS